MKSRLNQEEPKLQAPGAGLPLSQKLFLKLWVGPIISKFSAKKKNRENYERLAQKIIEKVSKIPLEKRSIRVLVNPMPGLEDSSRFWSLNGVLEHLLIVSKSMEYVIVSLATGTIPEGKADVAKVKPKNMETDALPEFKAYAPELMKRIDEKLESGKMNFESSLTFHHPWFGEITARQWYWLLKAHQGIHYRQAKEIISQLEKN